MPSAPTNFSNISATTSPFSLTAGTYGVIISSVSFNSGSVILQIESLDGVTYIPVLPAFTQNGYGVISLPAGTYEVAVSSATAVYASIVGID